MSETINSSTFLIQCKEETIHTPGFIQPHGFLIILKEPDLQEIRKISGFDRIMIYRFEQDWRIIY